MKKRWETIWCISVFPVLLTLMIAFGPSLVSASDDCPAAAGIENFGDANQPARDVAIDGNYAYTADDYGMTVYDIGIPANPQKLGELSLTDPGSRIAVSDNLAFVLNHWGALNIIDISDPRHPVYLSRVLRFNEKPLMRVLSRDHLVYVCDKYDLRIFDVENPSDPTELASISLDRITDIKISGDLIYVAYGRGLAAVDVSNPFHPITRGRLDIRYPAVAVGISDGLATLGTSESVVFVDISDPDALRNVGTYETTGNPEQIASGNHIACIAEGSTVEILDLGDPSVPRLLSLTEMEASIESMVWDGNLLYTSLDDVGLRILDIEDPIHPTAVGAVDAEGFAYDLVISGGIAFVADGHFGLQIIDISNPDDPTRISFYRLDGIARDIELWGNYALVADGNAGLMILDVSNLSDPELVGSYDTPGDAGTIVISADMAYLADGTSGLEIFDIHDPTSPELCGSYNNLMETTDLAKIGDIVYLAYDNMSVQILDVSDPSNPVRLAPVYDGYEGFQALDNIEVSGNLAFTLDSYFGRLLIYDLFDPTRPVMLSYLGLDHQAEGIQVIGDRAYVANRDWALTVVSIHDPLQPVSLSATKTRCSPGHVALDPETHTAWLTEGPILQGIRVGCPSCDGVEVNVVPESIPTGGAVSTINLYLSDTYGNPGPGQIVEGRSDLGTLSVFMDSGDGNYSATLSSGNLSGTATIRISINGEECPSIRTVRISCASGVVQAPVDLEVQAETRHSIRLNWSVVTGASGYVVTRNSSIVEELGPEVTSFLDTEVASGSTYCYRLASKDSCGGSSNSGAMCTRTPGTPPVCPSRGSTFPDVEYGNRKDFMILGDRAYLATDYGFTILDISDPSAVEVIGSWYNSDTDGFWYTAITVSEDVAYMIGAQIDAIDISDPETPIGVGTAGWPLGGDACDLQVADGKLYVASCESGFLILDISDPLHPIPLGTGGSDRRSTSSLKVLGDYLYVSGWPGLETYDVSDPTQPQKLSSISLDCGRIIAGGGYLYVGGDTYFQVIDISDPQHPVVAERIPMEWGADGLCLYGAGGYVAIPGREIVSIFDLSNPGHPELRNTLENSGSYPLLQASKRAIFGLDDGLEVLKVDCADDTRHADSWARAD